MDDEAMIARGRGAMTGGMPPGRSRGRLADEVYDTLLGQLMSLRIEPGSRVTIDVLARELGVSQTPIRDALNRMEAEGLVVRVPHAGYRIPPADHPSPVRGHARGPPAPRAGSGAQIRRTRILGAGGRPATNAGGDGGAGGGQRAHGLRRLRAARRRFSRSRRPERGEPGHPRSARSPAQRTCTCSGFTTTPRSLTWPWPSTRRLWPRSPRVTPTPPPTPCVGTSCGPASGSDDCSTRSRTRTEWR